MTTHPRQFCPLQHGLAIQKMDTHNVSKSLNTDFDGRKGKVMRCHWNWRKPAWHQRVVWITSMGSPERMPTGASDIQQKITFFFVKSYYSRYFYCIAHSSEHNFRLTPVLQDICIHILLCDINQYEDRSWVDNFGTDRKLRKEYCFFFFCAKNHS